jgi:hypothetical protein
MSKPSNAESTGLTRKDLENHIRKCRGGITGFAQYVSTDYVTHARHGAIEPFDVKLIQTLGKCLILRPSRPLTNKDVKVFQDTFIDTTPDRFSGGACGIIKKGKADAFLDLKRAHLK